MLITRLWTVFFFISLHNKVHCIQATNQNQQMNSKHISPQIITLNFITQKRKTTATKTRSSVRPESSLSVNIWLHQLFSGRSSKCTRMMHLTYRLISARESRPRRKRFKVTISNSRQRNSWPLHCTEYGRPIQRLCAINEVAWIYFLFPSELHNERRFIEANFVPTYRLILWHHPHCSLARESTFSLVSMTETE